MKILVIGAVLLSSIYVGATKLLMTQLDGLKDFYAHVDQYSNQVLNQTTDPITPPASLEQTQNPNLLKQLSN